jgi:hypothetical protein
MKSRLGTLGKGKKCSRIAWVLIIGVVEKQRLIARIV